MGDESRVNRRKARLIDTPPLLHNATGRLYFYFQGDTRNIKFYYPSPPFGLRRFHMVIGHRMAIESMKVKYIKNNLCV